MVQEQYLNKEIFMKKIIALLLAVCFLGLALAACGTTEEKPTETKATTTEKATNIYGDEVLDSVVDFKTLDFEGENINILVREDLKVSREWESEVIDDDDELEMAIAARNDVVEGDLNVNVTIQLIGDKEHGTFESVFLPAVQQDIVNGLHEIDVAANFGYSGMTATYMDFWCNLLDKDTFPYFEFDLPCWNQAIYKNGTVNGQLYLCAGDLNISMFDSAMIMWHNKDLYEEIRKPEDPEDIQDWVISGDWTYANLYKFSSYYADEDPVGNTGDIYALKLNGAKWPTQPLDAIPYAWQFNMVTTNNDGTHAYNIIGNTRAEEGLKMMRNLYLQDGVATEITGCGSFESGVLLFVGSTIYWDKASNLAIRNMEDKYSIVPWPKYDETQDHYATTSQDYFTAMSILDHSESDTPIKGEAISAYLEYATEYSYTDVRGYYFKRIIEPKFFGTDDSDGHVTKSIAIFNTIVDNLEYNFITIYRPMLNGVMSKVWRYNVIDEAGKPLSTTVASAFQKDITTYEESIKALDTWLGVIVE